MDSVLPEILSLIVRDISIYDLVHLSITCKHITTTVNRVDILTHFSKKYHLPLSSSLEELVQYYTMNKMKLFEYILTINDIHLIEYYSEIYKDHIYEAIEEGCINVVKHYEANNHTTNYYYYLGTSISYHRWDIFTYLISGDIKHVNKRWYRDLTHIAGRACDKKMLEYLLYNGIHNGVDDTVEKIYNIDFSQTMSSRMTAFENEPDIAFYHKHGTLAIMIYQGNMSFVQKLVENLHRRSTISSVNTTNPIEKGKNITEFHVYIAIEKCRINIAEYLLDNINSVAHYKSYVLHSAINKKYTNIVKLLVKKGIVIRSFSIALAIQTEQYDLVRFLVRMGGTVDKVCVDEAISNYDGCLFSSNGISLTSKNVDIDLLRFLINNCREELSEYATNMIKYNCIRII